MTDYKSYINALKQCAKEHKNDNIPFANIRTTDLCNDTADLLEKLETGINNAIEEITKLRNSCNRMVSEEDTLVNECYKQYTNCFDECLKIIEQSIRE